MRTACGRFASILVKKTVKTHLTHQGVTNIACLTTRRVDFAVGELTRLRAVNDPLTIGPRGVFELSENPIDCKNFQMTLNPVHTSNNFEATGNKVACCFDNVASTLLLVWTGL